MDDLTLKARLAERESIEKRFVQNTMQRINPWSEENRVVANRKQDIRSRQDPGFLQGTVDGWKSRRRAGQEARQAYRGAQARVNQAQQVDQGSAAMQAYNAQAPSQSRNMARTSRQNEKLVNAYAPELEEPTMVDDGTGAPAPDPAAPPAPDAQAQPPAGGNVTAVPGAGGGGAAGGAGGAGGAAADGGGMGMPSWKETAGLMSAMTGMAGMIGNQNMQQQQLDLQRQQMRQNDPARQAAVADATRRANQRGGLLNAATFGISGAFGRAAGRRDLRNLAVKSSDRADLEDLLLTKSAIRERDGTDRLRGIV